MYRIVAGLTNASAGTNAHFYLQVNGNTVCQRPLYVYYGCGTTFNEILMLQKNDVVKFSNNVGSIYADHTCNHLTFEVVNLL